LYLFFGFLILLVRHDEFAVAGTHGDKAIYARGVFKMKFQIGLFAVALLGTVSAFAASIPGISSSVSAVSGNGKATVNWSSVAGASSYTVYRSTNATVGYKQMSNCSKLTGLTCADSLLTNGTTYYYEVRAANSVGTGGWSKYATAKPSVTSSPTPTTPGAPTGVNAIVGNARVSIGWNTLSGATSYNVYRSTSATVGYTLMSACTAITTNTCIDTSAVNGTTYYYEVRGGNSAGLGVWSAYAVATPSSGVAPSPTPTPTATTDMTGVPASTHFKVTITEGGVAKSKFVYQSTAATVQQPNQANGWWDHSIGKSFSFSIFSVSGSVTVSVTKLGSSATSAMIRPTRLGIARLTATISGGNSTVSFSLNPQDHVSVEFSDDTALKDGLAIMAQPPETNVPSLTAGNVYMVPTGTAALSIPSGKTTIAFAPGVHNIGIFAIPSTVTQVYLPENAFVRGLLKANMTGRGTIIVNGRGVISGDQFAYNSNHYLLDLSNTGWWTTIANNLVDGIALVDSPLYTMMLMGNNSTISNVLLHGFQVQNDGIHIAGSSNVIKNNFFHNNDDNIVVGGYNGDTITDNVFWALEAGNSIMMNYVLQSMNGLTITRSDLIHANWPGSGKVGAFINALNVQAQNVSVIQNVTVSDVIVEAPIKRFIDLRMLAGLAADFVNWSFSGMHLDEQGTLSATYPLLMFDGADASHTINGFTFTDFTINGSAVTQSQATTNAGIMQLAGTVNVPTFK
jgi:hypothetical protein